MGSARRSKRTARAGASLACGKRSKRRLWRVGRASPASWGPAASVPLDAHRNGSALLQHVLLREEGLAAGTLHGRPDEAVGVPCAKLVVQRDLPDGRSVDERVLEAGAKLGALVAMQRPGWDQSLGRRDAAGAGPVSRERRQSDDGWPLDERFL